MSCPVYVDKRAGSKELLEYEPLASTAEACLLNDDDGNAAGDIMIVGNGPDGDILVGVEAKSIHDLISSINTGRLQATQLRPFLETYGVTYLLTYGEYGCGPMGELLVGRRERGEYKLRPYRMGSRNIPYGWLEGMLVELGTLGIKHHHCRNEQEAARWIGVLHRWWSKPWSEHKGLKTLDKTQHGKALLPDHDPVSLGIMEVASKLPAIGYGRAEFAAVYFNSIIQMICAPSQEWEKIPGVGKVIAKAVVEFIRRTK